MRLLLRASAHRPVARDDGERGVEVAASPDTPGRREPWQWHIRLLPASSDGDQQGAPGSVSERVLLSDDEKTTLEVAVDPAAVQSDVEVVELTDSTLIERAERDLLALLVGSGSCLVEGRHRLNARDAMVLEGDDPVAVTIAPEGAGRARLAVVRLGATAAGAVGWVP